MKLAVRPRPGQDERRQAILKIAYQAFLTDGYAATSMSNIAAKVGGSKATLYNYFASKEELFTAVIEEECKDVQDMLADTHWDLSDLRAALIGFGDRFIHLILTDDKVATYRLVTAETGRFPELGRAFYTSGPAKSLDWLSQHFDRAVADGGLVAGNTRVMASQFFQLCKGDIHHRVLWNAVPAPTEEEIREAVEQAVDTFLAAYGAA
jgi:AcrR family transcriptional regulator